MPLSAKTILSGLVTKTSLQRVKSPAAECNSMTTRGIVPLQRNDAGNSVQMFNGTLVGVVIVSIDKRTCV